MPKVHVEVPHKLKEEEAITRLKGMIADLNRVFADKIHHVKEEWEQNTNHFQYDVMGFHVAGLLQVLPQQAVLEAELPIAALPFKKRIEDLVKQQMGDLLKK
jgi:hypothetical protein